MATKKSRIINKILITDTSGLVSLLVTTDSNHQKAIESLQNNSDPNCTFITPSDVYTEMINILGKKFGREVAIEAANYINNTPGFLLVEGIEVYNQALDKFKEAKGFPSFTDCIVMAIADRYKTEMIFGFDECFLKNNYKIPRK